MTPRIQQEPRTVVHLISTELAYVPADILSDVGASCDPASKSGGLGELISGFYEGARDSDRFDVQVVFPAGAKFLNHGSPRARKEVIRRLAQRGIHPIAHDSFKGGIYGSDDVYTDYERSLIFQALVVDCLWGNGVPLPDLVHCHDWPTGLIPAIAGELEIPSVFTVHNHYTKFAPPRKVTKIVRDAKWHSELRKRLFFDTHPDSVGPQAYHQNTCLADLLCSGIHASTMVNAVSPSYLDELVHGSDYGAPDSVRTALAGKYHGGKAFGILNNIADSERADVSGKGFEPYTPEGNASGKAVNKAEFKRKLSLREGNQPLYFLPSRLVEQKGVQLLKDILCPFSEQHDAQFAIVADGAKEYESAFGSAAMASEGMIAYHKFDQALSYLGFAGADFVLMTSLYEPAGLAHRTGYRFGCLAVARATGGLKDSVQQFDAASKSGNGYLFHEFTSDALWGALYSSLAFAHLPEDQKAAHRERIMRDDLSRTGRAMVQQYFDKLYAPCLQ